MKGKYGLEGLSYYHILKIPTKGNTSIPLKEEVTDEEISSHYEEEYLVITTKLQEVRRWEENTREEQQKKKDAINKLEGFLEAVNEAFQALETKEKRERYQEEYNKNLEIGSLEELKEGVPDTSKETKKEGEKEGEEQDENLTGAIILRKLSKYQGKLLDDVKERRTNISNRALDVREDKNIIPYTLAYEGEEMQLLELAKIKFLNGPNMQDQLLRYILLFKKNNELFPLGYDFYANNIVVEKLKEEKYKAVFYEAIRRAIEKKERYIGEVIENANHEYFINLDDGRKSAVREHQKQLENASKRKKEKEDKTR